MKDYVLGEKKGAIFHLTLNRPDQRNAITFEMIEAMAGMVEDLVTDPEVRVIILKGEGKVFSAGVDFPPLPPSSGVSWPILRPGGRPSGPTFSRYQHYINRLEAIEIPIICAMQHRVLGLGLELTLACDIRLMSEDCLWSMPELKFGVIPDLGGRPAEPDRRRRQDHGDPDDGKDIYRCTGT